MLLAIFGAVIESVATKSFIEAAFHSMMLSYSVKFDFRITRIKALPHNPIESDLRALYRMCIIEVLLCSKTECTSILLGNVKHRVVHVELAID